MCVCVGGGGVLFLLTGAYTGSIMHGAINRRLNRCVRVWTLHHRRQRNCRVQRCLALFGVPPLARCCWQHAARTHAERSRERSRERLRESSRYTHTDTDRQTDTHTHATPPTPQHPWQSRLSATESELSAAQSAHEALTQRHAEVCARGIRVIVVAAAAVMRSRKVTRGVVSCGVVGCHV